MPKLYTKKIMGALKYQKIRFYFDEEEESEDKDDVFIVPAYLSDLPSILIKCIVSQDGKCTFMTKLGRIREDVEDKVRAMLPVLNELNDKYSFVTFSVNSDNDIYGALNFFLEPRSGYHTINEYFRAMVSICETASKEILPIIWRDEKEFNKENSSFDDDFDDFFEDEILPFIEEDTVESEDEDVVDFNDGWSEDEIESNNEKSDDENQSEDLPFEDMISQDEMIEDIRRGLREKRWRKDKESKPAERKPNSEFEELFSESDDDDDSFSDSSEDDESVSA